MSEAPILIPLDRLHPHPDNPRLVIRQDVVDAIAAGIAAEGFSPRHAPTVRPQPGSPDDYQVLAGHHRRLAAIQAGLKAVPCWVEDMDDEQAFLELVRSNRQSDLSGLEHSMHALRATERFSRSRNSVVDYARAIGRHPQAVAREVAAARVAASSTISSMDLDRVN